MDWIEIVLKFFGINWSPDGGSGGLEQAVNALFVAIPVAFSSTVAYLALQRKRIMNWIKSKRKV